jgi:transposase
LIFESVIFESVQLQDRGHFHRAHNISDIPTSRSPRTGGPRRRLTSEEEKTTILAELAKPGMRGTEVARRHGVSSGLLYTWRKERRAAAAVSATEMPFAPVLLTGPAQPPSTATTAEAQFIEIEVKGARVRLPGSAPSSLVAAAIKALRGRS